MKTANPCGCTHTHTHTHTISLQNKCTIWQENQNFRK